MKVLFITIGTFRNINASGIYTDLLRMFQQKGHEVFVICSSERREEKKTQIYSDSGVQILRVKTGNITKVAFWEKGISTLLIGKQFLSAYNKYFEKQKFDLILYSTPPITIAPMIKKIKQKSKAFTYLMLKDIFPQNAIDLEILTQKGIKGIPYLYFRYMEKMLYKVSDRIGCMSPQNIKYVLAHNPEINKEKVGLCPNTIDLLEIEPVCKHDISERYRIPKNKLWIIYGGNFGRPQNVEFIVKLLKKYKNHQTLHFIMCGSGTEFYKIKAESEKNQNVTYIQYQPHDKYIELLKACDIGLVFLDERFTIPNFPSRIMDYMNCELPILACTDSNTDLGQILEKGKCGWWVCGNDIDGFMNKLSDIEKKQKNNNSYLNEKGKNARELLKREYLTEIAYKTILQSSNE